MAFANLTKVAQNHFYSSICYKFLLVPRRIIMREGRTPVNYLQWFGSRRSTVLCWILCCFLVGWMPKPCTMACKLSFSGSVEQISVQWNGASSSDSHLWCDECRNASSSQTHNYACAWETLTGGLNTVGYWDRGMRVFTDTLGSDQFVTEVGVAINGQWGCSPLVSVYSVLIGPWGSDNRPLRPSVVGFIYLNGSSTAAPDHSCCGNCVTTQCVSRSHMNLRYNIGGANYLQLFPGIVDEQAHYDSKAAAFYVDDDDDGPAMDQWELCVSNATLFLAVTKDNSSNSWWVPYAVVGALLLLLCLFLAVPLALCIVFRSYKQPNTVTDGRFLPVDSKTSVIGELTAEQMASVEFDKQIGRGSFGDVYCAHSSNLGTVAVKVMPVSMQDIEKLRNAFEKVSFYLSTTICSIFTYFLGVL